MTHDEYLTAEEMSELYREDGAAPGEDDVADVAYLAHEAPEANIPW